MEYNKLISGLNDLKLLIVKNYYDSSLIEDLNSELETGINELLTDICVEDLDLSIEIEKDYAQKKKDFLINHLSSINDPITKELIETDLMDCNTILEVEEYD